jgi:hypothetical protein
VTVETADNQHGLVERLAAQPSVLHLARPPKPASPNGKRRCSAFANRFNATILPVLASRPIDGRGAERIAQRIAALASASALARSAPSVALRIAGRPSAMAMPRT